MQKARFQLFYALVPPPWNLEPVIIWISKHEAFASYVVAFVAAQPPTVVNVAFGVTVNQDSS